MTTGRFCNREVVITNPDASISEAAKLMREHHVGCIVVVESKNDKNLPVGIVTDRDLVLEVLAQGVSPDTVVVSDIMSDHPVTTFEDDNLWDTIKTMHAQGIHRVPVVDSDGSLTGILSVNDLLDLLSVELSQLTNVFILEQKRETETRA